MDFSSISQASSEAASFCVNAAAAAFGKRIAAFIDSSVNEVVRRTKAKKGMTLESYFGKGIKDYLAMSYSRCGTFKTILNPSQPLNLLTNYIHVDLSCNGLSITDEDLRLQIPSMRSVVVTGKAGSGKSMFMRWITLQSFERPEACVPIFVELRNLNSTQNKDILTYIRTTGVAPRNVISEDHFNTALSAGSMMLVLDGFDETPYESRPELEEQILRLRKNFPDLVLVVSGRQDPRFGSWSEFYVYEVDKLSKAQCLDLIDGLQYDDGVKSRFRQDVDVTLYKRHQSFLSSPLLTSIMLLTYEDFAEIPERVHLFYSQAFDTLFQRHDAQKQQFKRESRTGLSREEFRRCFAAFCAFSYIEQVFSFDVDSARDFATKAVKYAASSAEGLSKPVVPEKLIADLQEAVCMLQQDGLQLAYVHRSFQEYFTAVFITDLHGVVVRDLLNRCALRLGDQVVGLALEMNRETVEQEWVLPAISKLRDRLRLSEGHVSLAERYAECVSVLVVHRLPRQIYIGPLEYVPDVAGPIFLLQSAYRRQMKGIGFPGLPRTMSISDAKKLFGIDKANEPQANRSVISDLLGKPIRSGRAYASGPEGNRSLVARSGGH